MSSIQESEWENTGSLQRRIKCVGQLAASTVLVEQGLTAAMREISELAARALDVDRVSIWRHAIDDTEATGLEVYSVAEDSHEQGEIRDMTDQQFYMAELRHTHAMAVDDTRQDDRVNDIRIRILEPLNVRALLYFSIRREGRFIGSMVFSKIGQAHVWTAEEQAFAGVFTEFVSRNLETHARRQLETAFKDFADSASDWLWETDTEDRFTYLSDRFYELNTDAPEDIVGRPRAESGYRIEDLEVAASFHQTVVDHKPFRDIVAVRTLANGHHQWARSSGVPYFDEKGDFAGYRGVSTNITDRVQLERALRADEVLFRELIDAAPLPLTIIVGGDYVYGNTLAQQFFGVTEEEFIGMPARSVYVHQAVREDAVEKLLADGYLRNYEALLKRKDGTEFWASISSSIVEYGGENAYFAGFADISEGKVAEKQLTDNAALLKTILDAIPVSLSLRDLNGRIQFLNRHGASYYGKPSEAFIGNTLDEMFGTVTGATIEAMSKRVLKDGKPVLDLEYQTPRIPGVTMNVNLLPVINEHGDKVGIVTASDDITARKAADDQLRLSEAKFRDLVENSIQGVCIKSKDQMRFVNQALADIFGYDSTDEVLALGSTDALFPDNEIERLRQFTIDRLEGRAAPNRYRAQGLRRDGTSVWLEVMADVVDWEGDAAVQVTAIDITAEVDAAAGREQLTDALENFPEPVVLFDKNDRMIFHNAAYRNDLAALTKYDPMGQTFEDILHRRVADGYVPEAEGRAEAWVRERLEQHRSKSGPIRARRMREKEVWLDLYDVATPDGGSLMLFVDVTQLQQQEEQLRQAQKMDTIGQLTGGIAHDFNNILAIVQGNLGLIEADISDDSPLIQHLRPALRATERGANLTHRLLAFGRRQPLDVRSVDIPSLVRDMDEILQSSLRENIEASFISEKGLWLCTVDPAQLEQAILNLAINARDAMPNGGDLTIDASNIEIDGSPSSSHLDLAAGQYVQLTVSDTGTGMPVEVRERIFEPFFTTKEVGQGTGLGLSMVFGLAKQSAGDITVSSRQSVGTTFKLYLPRAITEANSKASAGEDTPLKAVPGETVLVVEDDDDLRNLVNQLLKKLGYVVIDAYDGETAEAQWSREQRIDLLLTDVVLPGGMTGPNIAAAACQARPRLRVLYMSGYTDDAITKHGVAEADIGFLKKPFTVGELGQKIRQALHG
ncbi:MAG: MEKHLA domain-containing protein [Rhodospirillaceae bacterium]|nr:MEKHLA domain-containing protein [Rhodospirillaceae bacterium]